MDKVKKAGMVALMALGLGLIAAQCTDPVEREIGLGGTEEVVDSVEANVEVDTLETMMPEESVNETETNEEVAL